MKLKFCNHLWAVVAIAMIILGCSKDETMSFDVPSDSILIEVGKAGTNSVVVSSVLILFTDLVLTNLLMG